VGEYRIIEDGPFEQAKGIMRRFEDDNGAKRPPMPDDRRKAKIDRIFNEYIEFLKGVEAVEHKNEAVYEHQRKKGGVNIW